MPTSIELAVDLLCANWNDLLIVGKADLYESGFFCGQIQKLTQISEETLFGQIKAAFLQSIESTIYANEAAPDRLESYTADIRAGLKAGAQFPITTIRKGATIQSLNPLAVKWHSFPPWLTAKLRKLYGAKVHPLDGFSRVTAGIPGADQLGGVFDHWGSCGDLFVSEPYDYDPSDDETLEAFCTKVGAGFRIAPVPYHHWKTTRVEILAKE
jgi:hypothetical protein